jgi:hypothetical protein
MCHVRRARLGRLILRMDDVEALALAPVLPRPSPPGVKPTGM